jgi:hypothetical protein
VVQFWSFLCELVVTRDRDLIWLLSQPLFWAALGIVGGPYLFYRGFGLLQLKRGIMNIPRSSIRSAALGPVEVSGTAVGPYTLTAPLSKEDCLFYRLVVVEDPQAEFAHRPSELCAPLFLDDGTGTLLVYPSGSDLHLNIAHQKGSFANALDGYKRGSDPDFIQEYLIKPGDSIFVFGTVQENRWSKRTNPEPNELSRIGPGFVSEAEADLLRREAFPFLSPELPACAALDSQREFDLHPPVIMMKGNGPFVISTDSQREVLTKLSWKSLLFIWGGPIATLWGLWEILGRWGLLGAASQN